jgi:hypothetical protein
VLHHTLGDTVIWQTLKDKHRALRRPLGHIGIIQIKPGARRYYCFALEFNGRVQIVGEDHLKVPHKFILCCEGKEGRYEVIRRNGPEVSAQLVSKRRKCTPKRIAYDAPIEVQSQE